MELATFQELLTPPGQRLLETACAEYTEAGALTLSGRLRRHHSADLVAAALTQARLRQRARIKFADDADRLYFTTDGYEQATRARVADHRAARFAHATPRRTTLRHVTDLGCGIGGDMLALARAGLEVTGFDVEPLPVAVANANAAALNLDHRARAYQADAGDLDPREYAAADSAFFIDPARRTDRGRIFDPHAYSPPWNLVRQLLTRTACAKVAPGLDHALIPDEVEAEWISDDGHVKELALWSGPLRTTARRRASVLPTGATLTDADDPVPQGEHPPTAPPGAYLYEPDGAVIRAGLVTAVAAAVSGALLDSRLAYVTSERLVATPFARAYRVEEVLPFDVPAIRAALRARNAGTVTVKKRGIDTDPVLFRRKLRARGPNAATVVLARVDTGALALLVEPVQAASASG